MKFLIELDDGFGAGDAPALTTISALLAAHPGHRIVPVDAWPDDGTVPVAVDFDTDTITWATPHPTDADVNAERARRIAAGVDVTVTGAGTVALQGRPEDQQTLSALLSAAQLRVANADLTTVTRFRDRENNDHNLVPLQIIEMWSLGMAWSQAVYEASWNLKDTQGGIPADYATNEDYWP